MSGKIELQGLTIDKLRKLFEELGEPAYRGDQVFNWIHNHLVSDFDDMLNLPKVFRTNLENQFSLVSLKKISEQNSKTSGTKKYLFETHDGLKIESVLIPEARRNTLCISTQVGCPLDCKFCATGLMGYKRNLTPAEIIGQYLEVCKEVGKKNISNIVYMGMGEPLLNFGNSLNSLLILTSELNTGISRNRITVSTVGIPSRISDLADSNVRTKLAISLHSCFDDIRSKIMPINLKYPLLEIIEKAKAYSRKTKTRITFEYVMLKGINDREEDIRALIKLCSSLPSKINIIPFNSIKHMNPGGISAELIPTPMNEIVRFSDALREENITVLLRTTQGDDIAAACGQLASDFHKRHDKIS